MYIVRTLEKWRIYGTFREMGKAAVSYTHLGTDMHNSGSRAPKTDKALAWLERRCDRKQLRRMLFKYPEYILNHKEGMER